MSYDVYRYIFYGSAVLSVIMLFVAVFLFFFLKIPKVIGDLNGSNARKAIENIRNSTEKSGISNRNAGGMKRASTNYTDKMTPSGRISKNAGFTSKITNPTAAQDTAPQNLDYGNETTVLQSNETTILQSNETTVLQSNETTVLQQNETTVLSQETTVPQQNVTLPVFAIEYEITYIHTDEII